ncbi:unnamed protein product [Fraxinus pennsylvanica]|uniref:Terpene synthase N-terminal domain-containing protein n=1 Tax=Fraxinus pennsylvanica TaxID=56036 RepID=A0AAD1YTE4_9LAMI|nr:unnamed protein product [Fraxinus pennsylvanica]
MDIQIHASAAPFSTKNMSIQDTRRSVKYHPSIWGDYFLAYSSNDILAHEEQEHQRLKEEVKKLLVAAPDDSLYKLDLIDAIQRLGVGYHFEKEIEKSLKYMYETYHESPNKQNNDLRTVALRFRLLRQRGYCVSCDVFNKFKDSQGKFEDSLISDVPGLLSLYEAAHFGVHGEEILEEALKFSATRLGSSIHQASNSLSRQVSEALEMPIHKTLTRLGVKKFLSIYQISAWFASEDINQECLHSTAVPMAVLLRVVNLARVINLLCKDTDGYSNSKTKLKDFITSIIIQPVIISK